MQNLNEIITIVPRLSPLIDGVGDYGTRLAQQLSEDWGWQTRFIVGDPNCSSDVCYSTTIEARSIEALTALLPSTDRTLLLHYVGHGYAKRGCPIWLVQALARWCNAGGRLITMFHELYATGPLLSSAILTSPIQKRLATQVMRMSDRVFTSRQTYANTIQKLSHQKHTQIPTLPIFSTMGECLDPLPLAQRSRQLVVFGGGGPRARVYQRSQALATVCHALEIEEILDIGPPLKTQIKAIDGVPVKSLGIQSAEEVRRYLSGAIAGILDYEIAGLCKSTIFAAYCAYGMLPIVMSKPMANEDGLITQQQFWFPDRSIQGETRQAIATAAHAWYQTHTLKAQARVFAECLSGNKEIVAL